MNYRELKRGQKFKFEGREGVLISDPHYETTRTSGLYYADVKFFGSDQIIKDCMICRLDIEWIPMIVEAEQ